MERNKSDLPQTPILAHKERTSTRGVFLLPPLSQNSLQGGLKKREQQQPWDLSMSQIPAAAQTQFKEPYKEKLAAASIKFDAMKAAANFDSLKPSYSSKSLALNGTQLNNSSKSHTRNKLKIVSSYQADQAPAVPKKAALKNFFSHQKPPQTQSSS